MPSKSQSHAQRHREPWTEAEDRLLLSRTLSNSELARQLGRTKKAVRHRRLVKGILNRPASRRWTEDELRLLGKLPDHKVAALTGRSLSAIQTRRITVLGLPCVSGRGRDWKPEEDRLLGKHSDGDLAKQINCTSATIARRRELLGIPPFHRENTRYWTDAEEKLLGTDTDSKIALKLGRTTKSVIHRRHVLGIPSKPVGRQEIAQRRRQMWIERKRQFGRCVVDPNDKPWTPEQDKLLGTEPDKILARKWGRTFHAVACRRQQMKIPFLAGKPGLGHQRKTNYWAPKRMQPLANSYNGQRWTCAGGGEPWASNRLRTMAGSLGLTLNCVRLEPTPTRKSDNDSDVSRAP